MTNDKLQNLKNPRLLALCLHTFLRHAFHPIELHVQALTMSMLGYRIDEIERVRGFNKFPYTTLVEPRIRREHVEDNLNRKVADRKQSAVDSIALNRADREKAFEALAYEAGISYKSSLRILKDYGLHGFSTVKPTAKLGHSEDMRQRRLQFCLVHKDWTLEGWKFYFSSMRCR